MDITYGVYPSGIVRATVDTDEEPRESFIPPDPANRDYAAYLAWVEDGGAAETLAATDTREDATP